MKNMLLAGTALIALVSGSAMAADMRPAPAPAPVYTKAPMMAPLFTWTGCYIGGNAGGLWARKETSNALQSPGTAEGSIDINSWLAGGQIGCNYQVSTWVFGIQGDYDWTNASGNFNDLVFLGVTDSVRIKSLASVTGRVGYAMDRFLFYVKGGGAWEADEYRASNLAGFVSTASETRTGWTAGVGGEYAFLDWLTGFVEYDYYDFGTKANSLTGTLPATTVNIKETKSVAKAGINFKFGGWH
jgi:outer membrane immunogenic protein